MGGRRKRDRSKRIRARTRRDPRVLTGILVKKRDAHLDEDKHAKARDEHKDRLDRVEEHRKKLIKMGFSEEAVNATTATGDEPVEPIDDEGDPQRKARIIKKRRVQGLVCSHLEQTSRRFHGVPPDATDKKQSRKRKGGAAPDPARYVPPPEN